MKQSFHDQLKWLAETYKESQGKAMDCLFECPLTGKKINNEFELIEGHIYNKFLKESPRVTVPQYGDIDSYYGSYFESDFEKLISLKSKTATFVISNPEFSRYVNLLVNEKPTDFMVIEPKMNLMSFVKLEIKDEGNFGYFYVHKSNFPDVISSIRFEIRFDLLSINVVLIKMAYLQMFRIMGYNFAFSTQGIDIGRNVIGKLYREFPRKINNAGKIRSEGKAIFSGLRDVIRPFVYIEGSFCDVIDKAIDSKEKEPFFAVVDSVDKIWAILIVFKIDDIYFSVLMPNTSNLDSIPIYVDYLRKRGGFNLRCKYAEFDKNKQLWNVQTGDGFVIPGIVTEEPKDDHYVFEWSKDTELKPLL